ncbi:MAG TPA: SDR family NAD(P)-dependent oxidoreductase [Mucilaginibacter sp.]|nr:SDR family NAD(P)-dependent oxidoreductase [Mucilaginibacter sp.]
MNALTAIVTGASEGLGKSLAVELASREIDLVLVSLPASGLPELANYIRRNFGVNVSIFETDLTLADSCLALFDWLKNNGIRAHILINNAGLGNLAGFGDMNVSFYKKQIELNVMAPVLLTRLFIAQLDTERTSYLLNVGSLAGRFIVPKKQVYGATKSFINYFTRCLQVELYGSNISISLLSPGGINTKPELLVQNHNLRGIARTTITEPDRVAYEAIHGMFLGKREIIPGGINKLMVLLNAVLPSFVKDMIIKSKLKPVVKL